MITKLRNYAILAAVILIGIAALTDGGGPLGWPNIAREDGGKRTISLIAYASNDSLEVHARVQTSLQGVILNIPHEPVDGDSWEYEFEVEATEHVSINFNTWVTRSEPGDRSNTLCRVVDNGDTVREERAVVPDHRRDAIAMCPYVA